MSASAYDLNVLVAGGSRNIGYHSALRLLEHGSTVTFLLRSLNAFDNDADVQEHIKSGKARLFKGDATNVDDVRSAWIEAGKDRPVDLLLFTVGFTGKPTFHITKGFGMDPPDLVTRCLFNFLCTMPKTEPLPRVIAVSASGVSASSRKKTPVLLSPLYGYAITGALADKLGVERVLGHCAGWEWNTKVDGEPKEEIVGKDWQTREGLPARGSVSAVVLRPAMLNDGDCLADIAKAKGKGLPYRTGPGEVGGFSVSRKDVAHFIVEGILKDWEKWGDKQLSIAY